MNRGKKKKKKISGWARHIKIISLFKKTKKTTPCLHSVYSNQFLLRSFVALIIPNITLYHMNSLQALQPFAYQVLNAVSRDSIYHVFRHFIMKNKVCSQCLPSDMKFVVFTRILISRCCCTTLCRSMQNKICSRCLLFEYCTTYYLV